MYKSIRKSLTCLTTHIILLSTSTVWADLPKPPDSDVASGNQNWIIVGRNMFFLLLDIAFVLAGAGILLGVAITLLKAYNTAQEKEDLSHFFKALMLGVLVAALGLGMCYAGYEIVDVKS